MAKIFEVRILITHDIKVDDDVLDFYMKQNNGDPKKALCDWLSSEGEDEARWDGDKEVTVIGCVNGVPIETGY